jgi:hypothetical protein
MATTTNYGWTTPDNTDLVKDGALAIRTLGSSVDTTTKALNPSTTLGDIEYRSATANTNTRLAVGTTGQVLTVAGGVPSWATPASGSSFVGVRATITSAISFANATDIIVDFGAETYDTSGFHDNSVNPSRLTIPAGKAGYYRISAQLGWGAAANGARLIKIFKNGSSVAENFGASNGSGNISSSNVLVTLNLAEADYLQVDGYQDSGGTLTLSNTGIRNYFELEYLGV